MAIDDEDGGGGGAGQPGRLILTVYGLYARERGGWLPIAGLVRLLAECGVNVQAVRSAIHRLKRRGLVDAQRRAGTAGYALTPGAYGLLAEGDVRIFGHARGALDDGWVLVVFSVPDTERAKRHQLRSTLTRLGFGTVSPGTWIAPRHLQDATIEALERAGLTGFTQVFAGPHVAGGDMADLVSAWWDLDGLQELYADFLDRFEPAGTRWLGGTGDDARAFVDLVDMLTTWRRLPYADPGLPLDLLPPGWNGQRAQELFSALSARLREPAASHVEALLGPAQQADEPSPASRAG
ncbi:PaaX family transcriptional regulator C-terminal domain-containing protein [Pseudonocardia sp. N23]|uniref:PaaX family transcriptional regulator n=1 Tax=Pseudonocardia sp. N23 TaxID=1987376 RepID=UPI000BFBCF5D|nr:PaaX family transcriptional regulator C-terminal domain-containing protein [Pseudonocardia sp. N23]GAY07265.1 possible membrane protein [Pseudonocardia sp. N23]